MIDESLPVQQTSSLLRRLSSLHSFDDRDVAAIHGLVERIVNVQAYEEILREGSTESSVAVVLRGLACRFKLVSNGKRQITGFAVAGDICDFGFLSSSGVTQSVLALSPVMVGLISVNRLSAVAERHPHLMVAFLRAAAIDQSLSNELVISLGSRNAVERVGHFLCEMHYRLGAVGLVRGGREFDLPLTQAEIGEALGLSTVHVNRTLQTLRQQHIISMRNGVVSVLDVAGLARLSGFDAQYLSPIVETPGFSLGREAG
jgi:CRP-like cAMP-binding protein